MNVAQGGLREKAFPYVLYRGRFYPIIPVVVEGEERAIVHALVGSGATMSPFHVSIAEDIGIDLGDAEQAYLAGIGGYVKAYTRKQVKISVEELGSFTIPIAFTEYIASDIAILDRQGFFEMLEVSFREWERKLIMKLRDA